MGREVAPAGPVRPPDLTEPAARAPVEELEVAWVSALAAHEAEVRGDYPGGPATLPTVQNVDDAAALWRHGRVFGVVEGDRMAVTAVRIEGELVETDFTSVARDRRRRGLAEAVKAASVLALAADGHRAFATGGADENTASIRMNERLGYRVEERWHT